MAKDNKEIDEILENAEETAEAVDEISSQDEALTALEKENEELKAKASEANDKYLRILAEFDNARKRAEKERLDAFSNAQIKCVGEFLPVIDALDRAMEAECTDESYKNGIEKIYSQLKGVLEKMNVKEIDALGKEFDPNLHNAIKQQETDEYEEGVICEVYQKGYMLGDKVLRYSMVVVAC